jgi:hypothetical protein
LCKKEFEGVHSVLLCYDVREYASIQIDLDEAVVEVFFKLIIMVDIFNYNRF